MAVTAPIFTIPVSDIERNEQHRSWTIPPEWLTSALVETDAESTGTIGQLTVHVFKNGQDFVTRGTVKVQLQLPCARTLEN